MTDWGGTTDPTGIGSVAGDTVYLYDVDRLSFVHYDIKVALKVAAGESKDDRIELFTFRRGCYVQMIGANPQVIIHYGEKAA